MPGGTSEELPGEKPGEMSRETLAGIPRKTYWGFF